MVEERNYQNTNEVKSSQNVESVIGIGELIGKQMVRDTLLGERKESGRPGRVFPENGTVLTEVEVLSAVIEAREVAELMERVQAEMVTLQIGDRKAQDALTSAKLRAAIDLEVERLAEEAKLREAKLVELGRRLAHDAELAAVRDAERVAKERQALADAREAAGLEARVAREASAKLAELELLQAEARARSASAQLLNSVDLEAKAQLRSLDILLINAQSAATVAERNAVQRQLVEALTALGDKVMLGAVAENMNLVSLFKGKDVGTILSEVLGGTKVVPTLRALMASYGNVQAAGEVGSEASD